MLLSVSPYSASGKDIEFNTDFLDVKNRDNVNIAQFDIVFASIADCQAYVANSASAVSLHQREIIRGACSRCGST
ncbi:hypothetical protein KU309_24035, partial [Salmonella enterica subsp. enterica serovar Mbandaka]|nr:hypothetical protein [Salmonella enterica subsp. enterica serovar Mbandaka]